jgi:hypothetical protein
MKTLVISNTHSNIQVDRKAVTGRFAGLRNSALALTVGAALTLSSFGFATPADAAPNGTKEGNEALCSGLRTLYVGNISIANDPQYSAAERSMARANAARAKADFDKYCKSGAAKSAGALATSLDLAVLPQDMAPATDGESSMAPIGPIAFDTLRPVGSRLDVR